MKINNEYSAFVVAKKTRHISYSIPATEITNRPKTSRYTCRRNIICENIRENTAVPAGSSGPVELF